MVIDLDEGIERQYALTALDLADGRLFEGEVEMDMGNAARFGPEFQDRGSFEHLVAATAAETVASLHLNRFAP